MGERDKPDALPKDLRTDWHRDIDSLVPLRTALYGYCRRLTDTVWDAEDLVQGTLVRAFARWGVRRPWIAHPAPISSASTRMYGSIYSASGCSIRDLVLLRRRIEAQVYLRG